MIIIKCYGVDPYSVGDVSSHYTGQIEKLFKGEEVMFIAPDEYIYNNGFEQTGWQGVIEINIDQKYKNLQDDFAQLLLEAFGQFVVHKLIRFNYFDSSTIYQEIDSSLTRFIYSNREEEEEGDQEIDPFLGDVFNDVDEDELEKSAYAKFSEDEEEEEHHHHHHHDHNHDN